MSLTSSKVVAKIDVFKSFIETYDDLMEVDESPFYYSIDKENGNGFDLGLYTCIIQNIYESILEDDENAILTKELANEILEAVGIPFSTTMNVEWWHGALSYLWE